MPTYTLTRGDRAEFRVTLTDGAGNPYDLVASGHTPRMELRRSVSDQSAAAEMSCAIDGTNPDNNIVSIVMPADASLTIPAGTYHARLLLEHTNPALDQITSTRYEFRVEHSATRRVE